MTSPQKESLITTRCRSTTCVALALTVAALVSYIVYLEADEDHLTLRKLRALNAGRPRLIPTRQKEFHVQKEEALNTYGFFFRTKKEQAVYEKQIREEDLAHQQPPSMKWDSPSNPSICKKPRYPPIKPFPWVHLPEKKTQRKRRGSGPVTVYLGTDCYHGCCTSRRKYISPSEATHYDNGQTLTVVQFPNNLQYFLSEDCSHNRDCPLDCGCQQRQAPHNALVENPAGSGPAYVVRKISIPGSCKCMNGLDFSTQRRARG